MLLVMIIIFLVLAIIGIPIGIAIGVAALAELVMQGTVPLLIAPQRMYAAVNSVTLMGIPFFMLAGTIMERSGITERLINFANALVGSLKGGMCYVSVLTGMLMGGISGSAPADTSALSSLMVPSMEKCGYKREFSAAIMASSGTLGIIIPPSMPMIVLGSITGISVGKLFLGGIIPGIMFGLSFMLVCFFIVTFRRLDQSVRVAFSIRVLAKTFRAALLPMLAPIIIVGGILTGIFTPTESAIAAVAYTLFLGVVVYRTIKIKEEPFALVNKKTGLRWAIDDLFKEAKINPTIVCEADECNALINFVSLHFGVSIIPYVPGLEKGSVAVLRIRNPGFVRSIYLAWKNNKALSPPVMRVKDFLIANYSIAP